MYLFRRAISKTRLQNVRLRVHLYEKSKNGFWVSLLLLFYPAILVFSIKKDRADVMKSEMD